ncbi:MAG: dockerin type I repeat-containing protein, partial [Oscillospiraceae bacterium]|nr:dockerin type I repeat-containing protein [Oscillospiraceae bacterium]
EVTGTTWIVTETKISGTIGDTGIAVIYNPDDVKSLILGDADLNGEVNIKDATLIQKFIAKMTVLESDALTASDVNADKDVNVKDATVIQKFKAGVAVEFKVGEPI